MTRDELLAAAREAARHAYAPYSHFRVGAAVLAETAQGERVITGANVENASYGLGICAERAALAATCLFDSPDAEPSAGAGMGTPPRVVAVAVACLDAGPGACTPCGACRQWLAELAPDATYWVDGVAGDFTLADLLPHPFHVQPPASASSSAQA